MTAQDEQGETRRIAEQLRRVYEGTSWLGPTVQDLVNGVDEELARQRPVAGAHTIWEITAAYHGVAANCP